MIQKVELQACVAGLFTKGYVLEAKYAWLASSIMLEATVCNGCFVVVLQHCMCCWL